MTSKQDNSHDCKEVCSGGVIDLDLALTASFWLTSMFDGLAGEISDWSKLNLKQQFSAAQIAISHEHRKAAVSLVKAGVFTSAPILLRCSIEAYISALWVLEFGCESDLLVILGATKPKKGEHHPSLPTFNKMMQKIKTLDDGFSPFFKNYLEPIYKATSDYAHSHGRQVSRWLRPEGLFSIHSDVEMLGVLDSVDFIGAAALVARKRALNQDLNGALKLLELVSKKHYREPLVRLNFKNSIR
ncbi:DUF6988 family protein [Burkholderia gladioli]|uniref:DUF6988 family protein n=1 Tax=Burkholderia gladioli TaxID=28095 RepID=UPI00163E9237|nr:hypothetical protein [Burkholderia gladioli]